MTSVPQFDDSRREKNIVYHDVYIMRQLILLHSLNELGTKIELCKIHYFVHILVVFPKVVFGFTNITHKMNIMGLLLPSSTVARLAT